MAVSSHKKASDASLRRYAKAVQGARADFERLYDAQIAARRDEQPLPFKLVALDAGSDQRAYFAAFEEARNGGWLRPLLIALTEAGLFATSATASVIPPSDVVAQVEAMTRPDAGMLRPERLPQGLVRSMKQVCRVLVDDGATAQGSGFLVGPQSVITCYHVIDALMQGEGAADNTASRLVVEFDDFGLGAKTRFSVQKDWLAAFRRCTLLEKPQTTGNARFGILSKTELVEPTLLDFALIRVAGTPGRERGYQRLDDTRWPTMKTRLWLFQHPLQFSQRLSDTTETKWFDAQSRLRLVHSANTAPGSSGGMCTNDAFDVVALHQCAMHTRAKKLIGNGAVPIAHIASIPEAKRALDVDPRLDPMWVLPDTEEPVFGREDFQRQVWEVAEGKGRLIVVRGGERSGKSFSKDILKAMLPAVEHVVLDLNAADLPPLPQLLAGFILEKIEAASVASRVALPSAADAATTDAAWVKDVLFPAFQKRLEEAAGNRTVWLVIDDLNHHTIPDTSVRAMLEMLYQQLANLPFLRIVLIGLAGAVPAADWRIVVEHPVGEIREAQVEAWFQRYSVEKRVALSIDEGRRLAATAVHLAKKEASWLNALPRVVIQDLVPALRGGG